MIETMLPHCSLSGSTSHPLYCEMQCTSTSGNQDFPESYHIFPPFFVHPLCSSYICSKEHTYYFGSMYLHFYLCMFFFCRFLEGKRRFPTTKRSRLTMLHFVDTMTFQHNEFQKRFIAHLAGKKERSCLFLTIEIL